MSELSEDKDIKLDVQEVEQTAEETEQKVTQIMKTYLGEEPDTSEALEFLCLAEGGEVTHYEVLSSISKNFDNKKLIFYCQIHPKRRTRPPEEMLGPGKRGCIFIISTTKK